MSFEMAQLQQLLLDGYGRIGEGVPAVIEGLSVEELLWRPDAQANHIAWLVWHLARQQDDQLAHLGGLPSRWLDHDWVSRFDLPYPRDAHGYGMSDSEVGAFRLDDPSLLTAYHADVHDLTAQVIASLTPVWLDEVIDRNWDPPVTAGVRIVSIVDDAAKHLGQAEYLRGLVVRRRS